MANCPSYPKLDRAALVEASVSDLRAVHNHRRIARRNIPTIYGCFCTVLEQSVYCLAYKTFSFISGNRYHVWTWQRQDRRQKAS